MDQNPLGIDAIFLAALEIKSPAELKTYLDQACQGNSQLRERVERLLKAHAKAAGSFMESPPSGLPEAGAVDMPVTEARSTEQPGATIGPYKLLQKLGEGGMGTVYMAEQKVPVARRVALKIIKPGMDSGQVIARFEAERQALAMMDHPNIAKVFDAGATSLGRPYFVMELVKGVPITQYCDDEHFTPKQRLELFVQVCHAVQHAHQKGIIHRDLKPQNILVADYDHQPVPKVIDFGIAKATHQSLTEKTIFTEIGQIVGTLEYMSPEQAKLNQLDVDTRTDVYSLGVLLYQLLTGVTPFDAKRLRSAGYEEMLRIIREEEPPKPSTRISTWGASSKSLAGARRTTEHSLKRMVRGDLDWIVMKALEKDRARRYETAQGFANDIQNHLNGDAVLACPPSTAYKVRKLITRHRRPFAAAALVFLALIAGVIGTSIGLLDAIRARKAAMNNYDEAVESKEEAKKQENLAVERGDQLKKQLQAQTITRLTAESRGIRHQNSQLSLLLAIEAAEISRRFDGVVAKNAQEALLEASLYVGGTPLLSETKPPHSMGISGDNRWLVAGDGIYDLNANDPATTFRHLPGSESRVRIAAFTPDSRRVVTVSDDAIARIWDRLAASDPVRRITISGFDEFPTFDPVFAMSHDGRWLAIGFSDGRVRVLNLLDENANSPILTMKGAGNNVSSINFFPDGRMLVTSGGIGRIWDLHIPQPDPSTFVVLPWRMNHAKISPDGRWLATAHQDEGIRLWNFGEAGLNAISRPMGPAGPQSATKYFVFSQDGNTLASIYGPYHPRAIRVWDLTADDPTIPIKLVGQDRSLTSLALSPDGKCVAVGSQDGTTRFWRIDASEEVLVPLVLGGHGGHVSSIVFSPDGSRFVTGSYGDKNPRLWDLGPSALFPSPIVLEVDDSVNYSGGKFIYTWTGDTLKMLDLSNGKVQLKKLTRQANDSSMEISQDGTLLVVGNNSGHIRLIDLNASDLDASSRPLIGREVETNRFQFSSDNHWLFAAGGRSPPWLWDLRAKDPAASVRIPKNSIGGPGTFGFSPNGRWLAIGGNGNDRTARLWDLSPDKIDVEPILLTGHKAAIIALAFSPDGNWLVTGSFDNTMRFWDLRQSEIAATGFELPLDGMARQGLAIDPNSRRLLATGSTTPILVDLQSRNPATTAFKFPSFNKEVLRGAISPDGHWAATGSPDGTLRRWDLTVSDIGSISLELRGNQMYMQHPAFSLDSKWVISHSLQNRNLVLWDLDIDRSLARARQLAGRTLTPNEREQFLLDKE